MFKILIIFGFLLMATNCYAQQQIVPCIQTTNANGGQNCIPISTSNPIPVVQTK